MGHADQPERKSKRLSRAFRDLKNKLQRDASTESSGGERDESPHARASFSRRRSRLSPLRRRPVVGVTRTSVVAKETSAPVQNSHWREPAQDSLEPHDAQQAPLAFASPDLDRKVEPTDGRINDSDIVSESPRDAERKDSEIVFSDPLPKPGVAEEPSPCGHAETAAGADDSEDIKSQGTGGGAGEGTNGDSGEGTGRDTCEGNGGDAGRGAGGGPCEDTGEETGDGTGDGTGDVTTDTVTPGDRRGKPDGHGKDTKDESAAETADQSDNSTQIRQPDDTSASAKAREAATTEDVASKPEAEPKGKGVDKQAMDEADQANDVPSRKDDTDSDSRGPGAPTHTDSSGRTSYYSPPPPNYTTPGFEWATSSNYDWDTRMRIFGPDYPTMGEAYRRQLLMQEEHRERVHVKLQKIKEREDVVKIGYAYRYASA